MRTIDATLQTALEFGSYTPYFLVTIRDKFTGNVIVSGPPVGYELTDLTLSVTIQSPTFLDLLYYRTSVVLARGVTVAGVNYTEDTSDFTIIDTNWDGNFQTFNCDLIPKRYYTAPGDLTYSQVITAFCTAYGRTAVFLQPAAAWLTYQFYPTGKSVTLNDARQFFNILRQKYFVYATDNGNNEILFYTAFTHVASPQYAIPGYHFSIDYTISQRRQYMWRDELDTVHRTTPFFDNYGPPDVTNTTILSLINLGNGIVLAGGSQAGHPKIFRSTTNGTSTWTTFDVSSLIAATTGVNGFLSPVPGMVIAVGFAPAFVLRSMDYGVTWELAYNMNNSSGASPVDCGNGTILVAHSRASDCHVARSTDYGSHWAYSALLAGATTALSLAYLGNGVVICGTGTAAGIYRSSDYGSTWSLVYNVPNAATEVRALLYMGNGVVIAGSAPTGWLAISSDYGATWGTLAQLTETHIYALETLGTGIILAGTGPNCKVFRSLDNGASWGLFDQLDATGRVLCFAPMDNGYVVAGTYANGYIEISRNATSDLDPIHNLGFMPGSAQEPTVNYQLSPAKFDPFPVNLKYQSSDHIQLDLVQGGDYFILCAQVTEILDLSQKSMPWRMKIIETPWLSNTAVGALPGTIERVASYTPLVTANFNKNLTPAINNLQSLADWVDDATFAGGISEAPVDGTPYQRKNASWVSPAAPGIGDAPSDGTPYQRKNASWVSPAAPGISDAASDGNPYVRKNAAWVTLATAGAVLHSLATAANDMLVASGAGTFVKKTLLEVQILLGFREKLTAARTYYVRTDGDDANTGLANSSGGAFLTIQKAIDVVATLDINGETVTIQIVDGTYSPTVTIDLKDVVGFSTPGDLIIQGNASTPTNVTIHQVTAGQYGFSARKINACWRLKDFYLYGGSVGLYANAAYIQLDNLNFGATSSIHMIGTLGGVISPIGNYSVSGSTQYHYYASMGWVYMDSITVTFLADVTYSVIGALADRGGTISAYNITYNLNGHTVTGLRFQARYNGSIWTNGAGANYFPGSTAGTCITGGVYDAMTAYPAPLDIYPVGAVVFRSNNTSPATIYGGTWSAIGSGVAWGLTVGTNIWIWKRTA